MVDLENTARKAFLAALSRNDARPWLAVLEAVQSQLLGLEPNEPFFTLKARDRLAPGAVRAWIAAATQSGVPEWKIEAAEAVLEKMERWSGDRRYPD